MGLETPRVAHLTSGPRRQRLVTCVRTAPHRRGWAAARRLVAVALCVFVLGPVRSAGADPSYVIVGTGDAPARTGAVAGEINIQQAPGTVAVRNDGVIAFATGFDAQVFWVERGRVSRIRMPAAQEIDIGLAFAVDGTLLVSTCDRFRADVPSAVWRVAPLGWSPQIGAS